MGEQGIVPSNYVEVVAGLPPAPLPQAPPGYAPQAAVPYGAPQQLGMPQQQVPMQQMPMVANTNANTNTTVVNIQGAAAGAPFVNPGGAQCHHIWGLVNIFCLQGWFCGIAAMLSACNASSATTDAQYQASIASARCCNIAGSCVGVVTLIIIIVVAVMAAGAAAAVGGTAAYINTVSGSNYVNYNGVSSYSSFSNLFNDDY